MKHMLSIVSTLVLGSALALSACGKKPAPAEPPKTEPSEPAKADPAKPADPAAPAPAATDDKPKGGW